MGMEVSFLLVVFVVCITKMPVFSLFANCTNKMIRSTTYPSMAALFVQSYKLCVPASSK
jgi:hypothetical protein